VRWVGRAWGGTHRQRVARGICAQKADASAGVRNGATAKRLRRRPGHTLGPALRACSRLFTLPPCAALARPTRFLVLLPWALTEKLKKISCLSSAISQSMTVSLPELTEEERAVR